MLPSSVLCVNEWSSKSYDLINGPTHGPRDIRAPSVKVLTYCAGMLLLLLLQTSQLKAIVFQMQNIFSFFPFPCPNYK